MLLKKWPGLKPSKPPPRSVDGWLQISRTLCRFENGRPKQRDQDRDKTKVRRDQDKTKTKVHRDQDRDQDKSPSRPRRDQDHVKVVSRPVSRPRPVSRHPTLQQTWWNHMLTSVRTDWTLWLHLGSPQRSVQEHVHPHWRSQSLWNIESCLCGLCLTCRCSYRFLCQSDWNSVLMLHHSALCPSQHHCVYQCQCFFSCNTQHRLSWYPVLDFQLLS